MGSSRGLGHFIETVDAELDAGGDGQAGSWHWATRSRVRYFGGQNGVRIPWPGWKVR